MCIIRKVDDVGELPDSLRVCDYDELQAEAKARLPELIESGTARGDGGLHAAFDDCDVVKYTDYYEITSPR